MAAGLKRENPDRTAAQVVRILRAQSGWAPSERTLQRDFKHLELDRELPARPSVFGRFEADRCNELWVGDAICRTRHKARYAEGLVMPRNCRVGWPVAVGGMRTSA
jgi:hypothetical protein